MNSPAATDGQLALKFIRPPKPNEREGILLAYLAGRGWVPSDVIEHALGRHTRVNTEILRQITELAARLILLLKNIHGAQLH